MPLRSRAAAVLGALALSTVAVVATAAPASAATVDGKVSFCHATGSAKNPYLQLKISSSATSAWSYTNGTHKNDLGTVGAAAAGTMPSTSDTSLIPSACLPDASTNPSNGTGGGTTTTTDGGSTANPSTSVGGTTDSGTTTTPSTSTGGTTGGTTTGTTGGTTVTDGTANPSAGTGGTDCGLVYTGATSSTNTCVVIIAQ
jgi:hypothetical protein